jgi:hypothetical protein
LVVELRNFGRWLARQIDNGFLQDEPLILKAVEASKPLDEFIKAKRFAATSRVGRIIQRILDGAPRSKASDIVEKLERAAKNDPDLAALNFPKLSSRQSEKPTPSETPHSPVNAPATSVAPTTNGATPGPEMAGARKDAVRTKDLAAQKEAVKAKDEQEAQAFLAPFQAAYSLRED